MAPFDFPPVSTNETATVPADWAEPQQGERDAHPISAQCCLRTPSLLGPLTKRTRKLANPTLSQNAKPDRSAPATRAVGLSVKLLGPVNDAAAHDPLPVNTSRYFAARGTDGFDPVLHAQRARPLRGSSMAPRRPPIGLSRRRAARERLSRPSGSFVSMSFKSCPLERAEKRTLTGGFANRPRGHCRSRFQQLTGRFVGRREGVLYQEPTWPAKSLKKRVGWRRGWDSNPTRPFRICNLQILKCRHCRQCHRCRAPCTWLHHRSRRAITATGAIATGRDCPRARDVLIVSRVADESPLRAASRLPSPKTRSPR